MKLNKHHISVLRYVRDVVSIASPQNTYICLIATAEFQRRNETEQNRFLNRVLFWRRYSIRDKWQARCDELTGAIQVALRGHGAFGNWFDSETAKVEFNFPDFSLNNNILYRQMRLAWLDRIIETGEIQ